MGQSSSLATSSIPETVDAVHYEVKKHAKTLSEIGTLTYDDFQQCLSKLNDLSRKCLDTSGKQLVFAVRKGTDSTMLWKATVQIACVKVDPNNRSIESYKFLNLKQFLTVFRTFRSHIELMTSSENQRDQERQITAAQLLTEVSLAAQKQCPTPTDDGPSSIGVREPDQECCICLERKTEVILPCTHSYCTPCIEQWNTNNKTCPICQQELQTTDDTWVLSERPELQEINESICTELMGLSKSKEVE